jgi:hypothetical protein
MFYVYGVQADTCFMCMAYKLIHVFRRHECNKVIVYTPLNYSLVCLYRPVICTNYVENIKMIHYVTLYSKFYI